MPKIKAFYIKRSDLTLSPPLAADSGIMLYYNRDFYCVQIPDKEVSCDGLLFNNIFEIPVVEIPAGIQSFISVTIESIIEEILCNIFKS